MKKRGQRRDSQYGKDQSGCIWNLVNILDFRRSRYARKLLSDKKRGGRRVFGAGNSGNSLVTSPARDANSCLLEDEEHVMADVDNPSVKKLIEEEMRHKQEMRNTERRNKLSDLDQEGHLRMHHVRTNRMHSKSRDLDRVLSTDGTLESEISSYQNLEKQLRNGVSIDKLVEEFCCHLHQNNGSMKHEKSGKLSNFKKRLAEAIQELINQNLDSGKGPIECQKLFHSKKLMNTLNLSSSYEGLLHQLMQNPNVLSEKYVQKLQNDKVEESELPDGRNVRQPGNSKHCKSSNRIIVLKPRSVGCRNSQEFSSDGSQKLPGERTGSHLSLAEVKRKFKHALGKQRQKTSSTDTSGTISSEDQSHRNCKKIIAEENAGTKSPSKDHFYFEIIPRPIIGGKRGEQTSKLKDYGMNNEWESNCNLKKEVFDLMVSAGNENVEFLSAHFPKARVLSLPEYNFSPTGSPGKEGGHSFITAKMRFSGFEKLCNSDERAMPLEQEDHSSTVASEKTQSCPQSDSPSVYEKTDQVAFCADKDKMNLDSHEVIGERNGSLDQSLGGSRISRVDRNGGVSEIYDDERRSKCSEQVHFETDQQPSSPMASPSTSSISWKVAEDIEIVANMPERPSPRSVLDRRLLDDDISPGKLTLQHGELRIQPLQLQFEDNEFPNTVQDDTTDLRLDEKESALFFVETMLLSSGMDWGQLCLQRLSSEQLLDPSLLSHNEAELFANEAVSNKKVLFDCTNEVLVNLCQSHSPWSLPSKPCGRPILDMDDGVDAVRKEVQWHLLRPQLPGTLEQIVEKEMAKTGAWMELSWETEMVGTEFSEAIFEELIEETMLKCVH